MLLFYLRVGTRGGVNDNERIKGAAVSAKVLQRYMSRGDSVTDATCLEVTLEKN